ncbi:MAG: hypothetical protein CYPHOPRED_005869 [Cyphobasidiales sp. Tagirdzhanova-0007]|nr:MAG: hypothetical protein CYPHOPRED_005869 [Cyphobasidiales sp. Tagirdzhanova-0007]
MTFTPTIASPLDKVNVADFEKALKEDQQFKGFCHSTVNLIYGFQTAGAKEDFLVVISQGQVSLQQNLQPNSGDANLVLVAPAETWNNLFEKTPDIGSGYRSFPSSQSRHSSDFFLHCYVFSTHRYQSFWAMYLPQNQMIPPVASVSGSRLQFAQFASGWTRTLDTIHGMIVREHCEEEDEPCPNEDHIVGRYVYLDLSKWGGKCKVYYEQSGEGGQDILFLHTAGSDGWQYHGVNVPL